MPDISPMLADFGMPVPAATRCMLTAQALHWLTVLLILSILPVAWVMVSLPRGAERAWLYVVRRSLGVTVLTVVAVRLALRAMNPPPLDGSVPALELLGRLTRPCTWRASGTSMRWWCSMSSPLSDMSLPAATGCSAA